ncbi:AbrB family transcriptional regulator [Corynebacterium qintianiae]|uniref:AbrB family transcriptional regulator n=1 Tax=Corynebacterium qintianiae TaxID=2709392 RepID=A0A7T0PFT3_9CORY|nr:AbrB family transcriptional regulator [Corynebacterium qintianiae]QPK83322.1 AbrB family transcriptional regulator [Corynebacterium qintianiae]
MRTWQKWIIVAPASVALGFLFSRLGVPAAWILGAIIASGAMALASGRDLPVNQHFFAAARGIIGVLAAIPLVGIPPRELAAFLVPGLVVALVTVGLAFAGGMFLSHHGVSRETGVLSLLAGGASIMPAVAAEVGADTRYVALSQYLRLLTVSVTLPLVASLLAAPAGPATTAPQPAWWSWLFVPALVATGQPLGRIVRLPNASVFGPLVLTALAGSLIDAPLAMPPALAVVAFLAIGWICGGGLNVPALRHFGRLLPATVAYIAGLMAACAAMGWIVSVWLGISHFEGYLATSPGALETVLALSAEGGAGPAVIAIQLIRLIGVLLFAAYLPQVLRRL